MSAERDTRDLCMDHSGCLQAINALTRSDQEQWEEMRTLRAKMDGITTRLNVILGGIVVAIFMLLMNIIFKTV